jgi:hypothetical protein
MLACPQQMGCNVPGGAEARKLDHRLVNQPFAGLPVQEVLAKLVEYARLNDNYAVWGQELVASWQEMLRPRQRVAFRGTEGVMEFLEVALPGKPPRWVEVAIHNADR